MNIDMIRDAATRLEGHARRTPLLSSPFLDDIAGKRIFVKAENLQHTGSFKFRGAWSAITALPEGTDGVIAFSSGNHAQGVAYAAALKGLPSVIVMPSDAPQLKIDNTRALGAEVVLYNRETESREAIGSEIAAQRNLHLIAPFDNAFVVAGQGTIGLEIAAQAAQHGIKDAAMFTCCGGGGLTSGIALALQADAPHIPVHPIEPVGFDDVARSLASGKIERNAKTTGSICDAIISPHPGDMTFPIMQRLCATPVLVSDEECLRAMAQAFLRLKLVLEPGGASALAAALFHNDDIAQDTIICTASGGNVDAPMFARALDTLKGLE
ncbi:threonine/serine dehydratase [Nereida sp. MMG025]|uniref:threonine ammonia-lyase n=1 Tax=Nereida sp. MMG025 TaxID=2909981 RepID=UPI001F3084F7|nr:threonine/serine dehydratase [Nereida sp. MMG025]MCF6445600.1 threonine/serine dehydratase [Nereida sp. MMG025]